MSGRLQERLTRTVKDLVDEVQFRFPVDRKAAQEYVADALARQTMVELVVRIVDRRLLEDGDDGNGGAS
jgi:hypothetical protein